MDERGVVAQPVGGVAAQQHDRDHAQPVRDGIGVSDERVAADAGGTIDPDAIRAAITPKTRLVALTHASNVLGTVQPVAEVGRVAREHDLLFLVDAAQTAGVVPIDVQAMHIDLLAFPSTVTV